MIKTIAIFCIALITLYSCNDKTSTPDSKMERTTFFDKAGMDTTVKPGDNFFLYANGGWIDATVIPADQSGWGSFYSINEDNIAKMKALLEDASAMNAKKNSTEQKLGDYYKSGMDTASIDKKGATPLQAELTIIDSIKTNDALADYMINRYFDGAPNYFGLYIGADEKNSGENIAILYQNGTSLPTKDYYTKKDSSSEAARTALQTFAKTLFTLNSIDTVSAAKKAQSVMDLETKLASFQKSPVEMRDPQKNYNKMARSDAAKRWPNLKIQTFFTKLGKTPDSLNVQQPGFFDGLNGLLASQPLEAWKTKLAFDYMSDNADLLSTPFIKASFNFGKTFSGQKEDSQRWKKMVSRSNGGLGDLLGKMYVDKWFTPDAKKRMDELVNNLSSSFENRINNLDWMSDTTKEKARVKLHAFMKKVGYPDKWKKYDDVSMDSSDFFTNAMSIDRHDQKEMLDKLGKPVDRTEWGMTTPTVNAYYNPTNNEIVFPAGILQFPFFDPNADDAINYGGIGMVIGHEMTHGFDDQGSQYDDKGNLKNWWQPSDNEKFKAKTGAVVAQYNAFTMFADSVHVNGELTLGENLADIGGLAIAYDAFKMTKQGKGTVKIDGLTPDQRFFLGFAQVWRIANREERMRSRLNSDPHSPEMFRINGPVQNFGPWYDAFNVKPGDKLYLAPEKRAHIW